MVNQIYGIIFFLIAAVIILNCGIEKELAARKMKKQRLKEQRDLIVGRRSNRVERYITSERNLVNATRTSPSTYIALLGGSILGGFVVGRLIFTDSLLAFIVAGMCIILPHAFLILKSNRDNRELAENLESAMRIITHEYIASGDLLRAVENSIDVIPHEKPFREFVVDCKGVSANMTRNLRRLEGKENNVFFSRWIDQLILTQSDRTQMTNLLPILDDMNDCKTAQKRNDTVVAAAWRDYFTLLGIIVLSPLLVRFVQYEWYMYLVTTPIGKLLVIALLVALIWATARALKINTPITG